MFSIFVLVFDAFCRAMYILIPLFRDIFGSDGIIHPEGFNTDMVY